MNVRVDLQKTNVADAVIELDFGSAGHSQVIELYYDACCDCDYSA